MRRVKQLPPVDYLRACLRVVPETGKLFWRVRPQQHFLNARVHGWWNSRYAGKEAFTATNPQGYFFGCVDDQHYLAHRVIWKLVVGNEPTPIVDHKDQNAKNNRIDNLREATKSQNNINSSKKLGVHFDKSRGNWQAYAKLDGKKVHFGRHDSKELALAARRAGVQRLFGEFAP